MGTVAIAGASGFVGSALCKALEAEHHIVGLTRSPRSDTSSIEWRQTDLYSLLDAENALAGCDYAIYLVHSMMPSARLTQASFEDLDFILADNFARAAASAGVKQIIYLGGLAPNTQSMSAHLASRLEVERTLASHGVPVTALRAGLVVGPGGSSLQILTKLVQRLPAMLTPQWTLSDTQPIALQDVVRAVQHVLGRPDEFSGAFDIGGPDVMTYREMMKRTAKAIGVTRPMAPVPLFTPSLSTLWVSLVTGASMELVGPLVQSLRHSMVVADNPLQRWLAADAIGFDESLKSALATTPRRGRRSRKTPPKTVRSVQRLPRPAGASARWIAEEYVRWLPNFPLPGIRCETDGSVARFYVGFKFPLLILRLSDERARDGRALFYIEGGALADTSGDSPGRFEFRLTADGDHVIAAIHEFRPRLPWMVYTLTQAIAHVWVMRAFGKHLASRMHVVETASSS